MCFSNDQERVSKWKWAPRKKQGQGLSPKTPVGEATLYLPNPIRQVVLSRCSTFCRIIRQTACHSWCCLSSIMMSSFLSARRRATRRHFQPSLRQSLKIKRHIVGFIRIVVPEGFANDQSFLFDFDNLRYVQACQKNIFCGFLPYPVSKHPGVASILNLIVPAISASFQRHQIPLLSLSSFTSNISRGVLISIIR